MVAVIALLDALMRTSVPASSVISQILSALAAMVPSLFAIVVEIVAVILLVSGSTRTSLLSPHSGTQRLPNAIMCAAHGPRPTFSTAAIWLVFGSIRVIL